MEDGDCEWWCYWDSMDWAEGMWVMDRSGSGSAWGELIGMVEQRKNGFFIFVA